MAVFGKKQKDLMDSAIATVISDGCVIEGNISSKTSIRIDGVVHGNVRSDQGVIIGNSGQIAGHVSASEAIIFGAVKGNIQVQKIEIKNTGKITGDISTQAMEVEFGAVYNGKVNMTGAAESQHAPKREQVNTVEA